MSGIKQKVGKNFNTGRIIYAVDSESDVGLLPTRSGEGKADWCKTDKSPIGSIAYVINGSKAYVLGTDGWELSQTAKTEFLSVFM